MPSCSALSSSWGSWERSSRLWACTILNDALVFFVIMLKLYCDHFFHSCFQFFPRRLNGCCRARVAVQPMVSQARRWLLPTPRYLWETRIVCFCYYFWLWSRYTTFAWFFVLLGCILGYSVSSWLILLLLSIYWFIHYQVAIYSKHTLCFFISALLSRNLVYSALFFVYIFTLFAYQIFTDFSPYQVTIYSVNWWKYSLIMEVNLRPAHYVVDIPCSLSPSPLSLAASILPTLNSLRIHYR